MKELNEFVEINQLIIVIIIVFLFWYIHNKYREEYREEYKNSNYKVVGYNNFTVYDNPIKTVFMNESDQINEILDDINKKMVELYTPKKSINDININDMRTVDYLYYNTIIPFPYNDILKETIFSFIKDKMRNYYKNDKLEITGELFNVYYMIKENNIYLIFDLRILNVTKFSARIFRSKVKFVNCTELIDYLLNKTNVINNATCKIELQQIILRDNQQLEDNFIKKKTRGIDALSDDTYYKILNKLYLMSPFITSSNVEENNSF